jgi:hypothetical protein
MATDLTEHDDVPVDLLQVTEEMYREAAENLTRAIREVRKGKLDDAKATQTAVRDMKTAFAMVMDERSRVDKLRRNIAGLVGGQGLDFHAARDEIGRRLACLRDAGGG